MKYRITDKQKILEKSDKNLNTYQAQLFWVETLEKYPHKICVQASGKGIEVLNNYNIGDEFEMELNIASREYNEKIYHTITLKNIS